MTFFPASFNSLHSRNRRGVGEVFSPLYLGLLLQVKRLLMAQRLLTDEDRSRIEALEEKLRVLNEGGFIGTRR
jgi:hypothetical protein